MSQLYISTRPVRAEQYQAGMTEILGRPIIQWSESTTFQPHTPRCIVRDGDWVVEVGPFLLNTRGQFREEGMAVRVVKPDEFEFEYRGASVTEINAFEQETGRVRAARTSQRLKAEAEARAKALAIEEEDQSVASVEGGR